MTKKILTNKVAVASILGVTLFTNSALFADSNTLMNNSKMDITECKKIHKQLSNTDEIDSKSARWKAFDETLSILNPEGNDGGNN